MQDFKFGEPQNVLERLSAQGTFESDGVLKDARIEFSNISSVFEPKDWPGFVIDIIKVGDDVFELEVFGNVEATPLTFGENFIGELPESRFELNLVFNSFASEIKAVSEVILKNAALPNILGDGRLSFKLDSSAKISDCIETGCDLLSFDFGYDLFFDQESISIASTCYSAPCHYYSISHSLKTSDTGKIFTIIGQSKILNPIYIAYLYSIFSTGIKADNGHEIRIN
jgi:hypothetical protein